MFATVHLQDGTFLLIAADDEWLLWGRCDGDTGAFTDEDTECDVVPHDADLAKVAGEFAELLDARGWKPAQPQPPLAGRPSRTSQTIKPPIPERVEEANPMAIEDVRAKVARWQANLLGNAAHDEREAGRAAKQTADSIRQTARDMRYRARELGKTLAILREHASASQMTAALEARRGMLRARAEQLPPKRSYGPARRRLSIAADDCADVIGLLREIQP